jgi:hypothetical protein
VERTNQAQQDGPCFRYRLELDGEIAEGWADWFGSDVVQSVEGSTVLEVTVTDQAALHGVLRRVHDLHLRLISLTQIKSV